MSDIFITIDPTVQHHKGGFAKYVCEYIIENEIPHEINNRIATFNDDHMGSYYINSYGNISKLVKVFGSKFNPSTNSIAIDPVTFWSIINKQNTFYTTEEWVNIICAANSADIESRELALSLAKNADHGMVFLVRLVLTLVFRHKNDHENDTRRFLLNLHRKNNLNREIDIDYYTSLLAFEELKLVLSDTKVFSVFMSKYRHWFDFSGVKIK